MADTAAPIEIRVRRAEALLEIDFADGTQASLPAEYLRTESPSAEVQGHHPSQHRLVHGKRNVGIAAVEPVGHYALRIRFTDGHDSGIFTWALLHQLAQERARRWAAYLDALAAAGRDRDR